MVRPGYTYFMKYLRQAYAQFIKKPWLGYVLVFLLTLAVYGMVQSGSVIRDPDTFYHVKMAQLITERGVSQEFPWLPFTFLATDYADHQFLYHVLLVPFLAVFGPLAGAKAAAALFGALAVLAVYWVMRTANVRYAAAFALLLAFLDNFMFRMNLAKTSSLSIIILMVGLVVLMKKKPWMLLPLSFMYVWTYGGWPLLPVMTVVYTVSVLIIDDLRRRFGDRLLSPGKSHLCVGKRAMLATAIGSAAGIVLNPYFPANIRFYIAQIGHITLKGYGEILEVGVEWYPFPFGQLVAQNILLTVVTLLTVALIAFAILWRREAGTKLSLFEAKEAISLVLFSALALMFFLLTMKSRRHVEYFLPFMMLADAVIFSAMMRRTDFGKLKEAVLGRFLFLPKMLTFLFFFIVPLLAVRDANTVIALYRQGHANDRFSEVAVWINENVPEGDVIFHSRWSDFPALFYRSPSHAYISGLDPTFLYLANPDLYGTMIQARMGLLGSQTGNLLREGFGTDYLLVRAEGDEQLMEALDADSALSRAYEDTEVVIYSAN
jgi:hypothetical protein